MDVAADDLTGSSRVEKASINKIDSAFDMILILKLERSKLYHASKVL